MLSSHLALPQEGYLQEFFQMSAYTKEHLNTEMAFDPSEPGIDLDSFQSQALSYSVYLSPCEELKKDILPNMPKPIGKSFTI